MRLPHSANEPGDAGGGVVDGQAGTAAELARSLRATARAAATTALRQGLEEIEEQHGIHVADEVAGLIDVADVFAGLREKDSDRRDEGGSFEFTSYKL